MSHQVFYITGECCNLCLLKITTTGSSSGFGRFLTNELAKRGHKVIATARTINKIDDLSNGDNIKVQQLDVTDSPDVIEMKVKEAISFFGKVDVLVNNAGYSQAGGSLLLSYYKHPLI